MFLALVLTAVLHGPAAWLRRSGVPRGAAAAVVLFSTLALASVVGYLVEGRVAGQVSLVRSESEVVLDRLRTLLAALPGQSGLRLSDLVARATTWLDGNQVRALRDVLTVGTVASKVATVVVLTVFLTFFFLSSGARLWSWSVRLLPAGVQGPVNGAGHSAWRAMSGWTRGSAVIAVFHAVVIGGALWLIGAPLVLPLAGLVFLGSFVPIAGVLVSGAVAVLVVLLTLGPLPALVVLGVLVVEDQVESHLLQPFVVGRAVRLHPVAIVVSLTVGVLLGGVLGGVLAVPLLAAGHAAVKYLTGIEDVHGRPLRAEDRSEPLPPPERVPRRGPA